MKITKLLPLLIIFALNHSAWADCAKTSKSNPTLADYIPDLNKLGVTLTASDVDCVKSLMAKGFKAYGGTNDPKVTSFKKWWDENQNTYTSQAILYDEKDKPIDKYVSDLYATSKADEAAKAIIAGVKSGDQDAVQHAIDNFNKQMAVPPKSDGVGTWTIAVGTGVTLFILNTLKNILFFSTGSQIIGAYANPVTDPVVKSAGKKGADQLKHLNTWEMRWFQGSGDKGDEAAKLIAAGKPVTGDLALYGYPGTNPQDLAKFLDDMPHAINLQVGANNVLMQPYIQGIRDYYQAAGLGTSNNYAAQFTNFDILETDVKTNIALVLTPALKQGGMTDADLKKLVGMETEIDGLHFASTNPKDIRVKVDAEKVFLKQLTAKGVPESTIAEFLTAQRKLLGASNAEAMLLAQRVIFEILYPEDNRGLRADSGLKDFQDFARDNTGMYRWIEQVGPKAQKILDRLHVPVNLQKYYEARGYGPEKYQDFLKSIRSAMVDQKAAASLTPPESTSAPIKFGDENSTLNPTAAALEACILGRAAEQGLAHF